MTPSSQCNTKGDPVDLSAAAEAGPVELASALVNIYSVSDSEATLADAVEQLLRSRAHLEVIRHGDTVIARTNLGRPSRVILAGHLDTVPVSERSKNFPGELLEENHQSYLWGRGSVDMKAGLAVFLGLAYHLTEPAFDLTYVFYDHEEVEAPKNGLGKVARSQPDLLLGDFAILGEPTDGGIEGGCNGTLRVVVQVVGKAAHSARAWRGKNAIHAAAPLLQRISEYTPQTVRVDGLAYREGLSVVWIEGGIAKNSIPDRCRIWVNYRFAPDKTEQEALAHLLEVIGEDVAQVTVEDSSPAARPGLDAPLAQELTARVKAAGGTVGPKYGWTDVARFSQLGVPAVNFAPGDPMLCHTDEERVPLQQIKQCYQILWHWLRGEADPAQFPGASKTESGLATADHEKE